MQSAPPHTGTPPSMRAVHRALFKSLSRASIHGAAPEVLPLQAVRAATAPSMTICERLLDAAGVARKTNIMLGIRAMGTTQALKGLSKTASLSENTIMHMAPNKMIDHSL